MKPGLLRLVLVELRKMADTRAGFWLQLISLAIVILVGLVDAFAGDDVDQRYSQILSDTTQAATFLLPVTGILLVTSEWTQRTTLISFALVPRRPRLIAAKVGAGVALAAIVFVFCFAFAALCTALSGTSIDEKWSLDETVVAQSFPYLAVSVVTGIAFGALILNTAPAIVAYFLAPTALIALGAIEALEDVADWTDQTETLTRLTEGTLGGKEWAQAGTTFIVWVVVPLAVGWWRIERAEIR